MRGIHNTVSAGHPGVHPGPEDHEVDGEAEASGPAVLNEIVLPQGRKLYGDRLMHCIGLLPFLS